MRVDLGLVARLGGWCVARRLGKRLGQEAGSGKKSPGLFFFFRLFVGFLFVPPVFLLLCVSIRLLRVRGLENEGHAVLSDGRVFGPELISVR